MVYVWKKTCSFYYNIATTELRIAIHNLYNIGLRKTNIIKSYVNTYFNPFSTMSLNIEVIFVRFYQRKNRYTACYTANRHNKHNWRKQHLTSWSVVKPRFPTLFLACAKRRYEYALGSLGKDSYIEKRKHP